MHFSALNVPKVRFLFLEVIEKEKMQIQLAMNMGQWICGMGFMAKPIPLNLASSASSAVT